MTVVRRVCREHQCVINRLTERPPREAETVYEDCPGDECPIVNGTTVYGGMPRRGRA